MPFEPALNTFPSASGLVITGFRDHLGKIPAAIRRPTIISLAADDFTQYDTDTYEPKDSFAVIARCTNKDFVVIYRSDDRVTRDNWLRANAPTWIGYL